MSATQLSVCLEVDSLCSWRRYDECSERVWSWLLTRRRAASGIGLAAAQLFVEQGARIVATDIQSLEPTRKAIEKLLSNGQVVEDKALLVQGDVTDEASVANVCQAGLRHFGKIDGAVLNAGMCPAMVPWLDCPAEQIEQTNR